ncbi:HD-GYP domain-containing protein (c-di-GMP phosphodiesterase class II) [Povalibacter uvarum]|uniref:HD-GYP domain-containing protein (C-di-GMP phosphodiesterase class II) n=1 Tax=Povalibacter uvarum TaxID=732238 RepID=A0A841HWC5_9GAMM|nr:HD domain-containing phosphohydrolase [Povalibacter uvarum]MBB6096252.1 HD-GYP domain-containing protein (c-di-GMP phosphodiesterase class II) [Povalibacter uvarum]
MDALVRETAAVVRALQERDDNTADHCGRASGLALEIGRACGLASSQLAALELTARLHDVGKIGIPDRVLLKPGRLDEEELQIMRTHPRRGYDILIAIPRDEIANVADAVLHHHEACDGTGYPDKLRGEAIPLLSRILAVADAYDALATVRPYHAPRSHAAIMTLLEERASKYDASVLLAFNSIIESSAYRSRGGSA